MDGASSMSTLPGSNQLAHHVFTSPGQEPHVNFSMTDADVKVEPSSGPIRAKVGAEDGIGGSTGEGSSKGPIAAPVKSACTFCRSRKQRCDGKQPCSACVNRSQPDDCHYTVSRRGGKPKAKNVKAEPIESHLDKIFELSDLPHLVRIPNAVPQLQGFMMEDDDGTGVYSVKSGNPQQSLSPTFSSGRSRSESIHLDNVPATRVLLGHFYSLFYRFIPILPCPKYLDHLASTVPSDSPFLLALQCVLPVIRNEPLVPAPSATHEEKKVHIRTQSAYLAKKAESAIDTILEQVENRTEEEDYHTLEVIQALCLLTIYEYGSGRALKARLKADTALGIAMSKGLHRLSAANGSNSIQSPITRRTQTPHFLSDIPAEEMYEVKKRMWWSLWSMTMWTAYNTGRIPTIRADDPRITSELPQCKDGKAWAFNVSSLQGLLLVQDRVLALSNMEDGRTQNFDSFQQSQYTTTLPSLPFQGARMNKSIGSEANDQGIPTSFSGHPTTASRQDILQSMLDIDTALQEQMKVLNEITYAVVSPANGSTPSKLVNQIDDDTRYLHFVWAIQLYTASLTLHVGQAFQGATLFERKLCFLSSISESNEAAACQVPMPNAFDDRSFNLASTSLSMAPQLDLYARGPFLPRDSLKRCVDASDKLLEISRNLRALKGPYAAPNNPFNACSFVLISFVCLMQALAISTNVMDDEHWQSVLSAPLDDSVPSTLLKSAQGAAALTQPSPGVSSSSNRQVQLQRIWDRVKEAKGTLEELAKHWDMVIPMAEEVGGCLEASQFLLSQQDLSAATPNMGFNLL